VVRAARYATLCAVACLLHGQPVQPRVCANHLAVDSRQIRDLRTAIQKMNALPDADCRSWHYQTAIHGFQGEDLPTNDPVPKAQCQHGNYFFLPWHRMYLHYFERLVRRFSCDDTFRIPYWDWTAGGRVKVPDAFNYSTDPVLYVQGRLPEFDIDPQDLKGEFANPFYSLKSPFGFGGGPVYDDSEQGVLFTTGHYEVHLNAKGWLQTIAGSAQDPLFFLLHANVDRLWESWAAGQYGRNPPDANWVNKSFTFCTEIGAPEKKTVSQILGTAALGYSYDRLETPQHLAPIGGRVRWVRVSAANKRLVLGSEAMHVELPFTQEKLLRQALEKPDAANLRLDVNNLNWRTDPNVRYEACFDSTECKVSAGYVNFFLFAAGHHHEAVKRVPVEPLFLSAETVRRLADLIRPESTGTKAPGLHLTLVPRAIGIAGDPFELAPGSEPTIGSLELSLAEVLVNK
jgi:hypothetical protein